MPFFIERYKTTQQKEKNQISQYKVTTRYHIIKRFTISTGTTFGLYYSKSILTHIVHFIDGVIQKGFSGTLKDIYSLTHNRSIIQLSSIFSKLQMEWRDCFISYKNEHYSMFREKLNGQAYPFLSLSMIEFVRRKSLRHKQNHPFEVLIFLFLINITNRLGTSNGGNSSLVWWSLPSLCSLSIW